MSPAKKKAVKRKKKRKLAPKEQIVVITERPIDVVQQTVPKGSTKGKVWEAVASLRQSLFLGFWAGVGLAPIGSHIISQFYCGKGETARCDPIEFPAWLELVGLLVALACANAMRDVVSKSLKQIVDIAKDLPSLVRLGDKSQRDAAEQVAAKQGD